MKQILGALILVAVAALLFAVTATGGGWKQAVATWAVAIVVAALVVVAVGLIVGAL